MKVCPRINPSSRTFPVLAACLSLLGFSSSSGAPVVVPVRFIDSATGCALQPESVVTQLRGASGQERHFAAAGSGATGLMALELEPGRHTLTAIASGHRPISAEVEALEAAPGRLRFFMDPETLPPELTPEFVQALQREDSTVILGFVVDDDSGEPLAGVSVRSNPSGVETRSDARGFYFLHVPLQAEAQAEREPADLVFRKRGFQTQSREHLELWPRGDWTYRIRLAQGHGAQIIDERNFRRRLPADPEAMRRASPVPATPGQSAQVSPSLSPLDLAGPQATASSNATVRVPRNIRVLLSDNVTIDYVTLDYYCKHVLPAEWIASWANYTGGSNSLNAGAVALRTYAIGYINTPRGSTYDICATTSCQVYGTATSSYSDTAVNYTANYVEINAGGAIPSGLTEYSAENNQLGAACGDGFTAPTGGCLYDPVCAGETTYGHGRGMCQWGTARWATGNRMAGRVSSDTRANGYPRRDWVWLCQHYYPALTLVKGAPLIIGDDVKALKALTVYACADGGITNGILCPAAGSKVAGATGTILAGPNWVTNSGTGGFTWYQVQWSDSTVSWAQENYLERVFSAPAAPGSLAATATGTNQINLSWTDSSAVEAGFKIERGFSATGSWVQIASVGAGVTSYSDKNLPQGSKWFYRVRAWNAAGASGYSAVASATTSTVPPTIAPVPDVILIAGETVSFSNSASAPERVWLLTDFTAFPTETANGVVMFRDPRYSGSTVGFIAGSNSVAAVTDTYPTAGHGTGLVLRVSCRFTNYSNPWLRLTTSGTATLPNPVIDFTRQLRFDAYADNPVRIGLGCRETTTAAGTAIGSDGGTTGGIEWVGVTNQSGTAPMPTRTLAAGSWTTLTFDLATEPAYNFTGGNGVLSTASGLGVLEHLAIVPVNYVTNIHNLYLDNFAVVGQRALTWSLGPNAPAGAAIDPATGVFTWASSNGQAPSTNLVSIIVTDDSLPPLSATNAFTVAVLSPPAIQVAAASDANLILSWDTLAGRSYRVQYKHALADPLWTDLVPDLLATGATLSLTNSTGSDQGFYRVVVLGN